jgi:transcription initiation factor TFIIIB Brf1 subunit/transcription initiation factor TFIIB
MEEFEDFDYNDTISILKTTNSTPQLNTCSHSQIELRNGERICIECGTEIEQEISTDPDWRYYGDRDNKFTNDPSRCSLRRFEEKNLFKDVDGMNFPDNILNKANEMYLKITEGKIRRGDIRKSLIFACVYNAFKYNDDPQLPSELRKKFGLSQKKMSSGLNYYNLQTHKMKQNTYSSPSRFISKIMKKMNASLQQIKDVEVLFDKIQNKSTTLNRSNPLSVVSGLIYYYCKNSERDDITAKKFSDVVGLSENTIIKIAKIIAEILGTKTIIKL